MMKNLKWNWLVVSKLKWGIWQTLTRSLKSLKNFHFTGLLLSKVYIAWAKKVQMSYLSWHWRVMQNLKKNWLVVGKMTWRIWQTSPEHSKVSKFGLLWDPFSQSRKCISLKFTEKNDAKFGEKLTWSFKFDMRHLTNVDSST